MIFTELQFVLLFAAGWLAFVAAPRTWRAIVLAAWGAVFYATYAQAFLAIVAALTLLVYVAQQRRLAIAAGGAVVAVLAYFKLQSADLFPGGLGDSANILIPLGLSYLSFELLHILIERRRGRLPHLSLSGLLAFVFFVPARISGPIKRYPQFIASVQEATVSTEGVYAGIIRIVIGLAKKLLVADVLRLTVESELGYVATTQQAWTILLAYTLQIYLDFSAYTDIAIGYARTLGIALPENFNRPYLAPNIREFWGRWHITLSNWVRDYVFLPTGQRLFHTPLRSSPAAIAAISYLTTFVVVGLWHGLTVGFIIWGLYHGVLLSGYHVVRTYMPARIAAHSLMASRVADAAAIAATFFLVAIGWIPFMSPDLDTASRMIRLIAGGAL